MGFGQKTDPTTGNIYDLDKTYTHIIKPCAEKAGFRCVRADEIKDSGLIDRSMYVLLMRSDLVIADISTYNPNAIYELGVRHAVKPYSTIIMKEENGKIPFDINHNRIFEYSHLGQDIGATEVERCSRDLTALIKSVCSTPATDSPMYAYLTIRNPPEIDDSEYEAVIADVVQSEKSLYAITELAKEKRKRSEFSDAAELWKMASEMVANEDYFIQQHALCTYKSKKPSELMALTNAFGIIENLLIDGTSNDPETLGICGAINKRIWESSKDVEYLKKSAEFYEKGYAINGNFYTGENFAECLDILGANESDPEEKIFNKLRAKKIRESIISSLRTIEQNQQIDPDCKWQYASLSACYFRLGNMTKASEFESKFRACSPESWEIDTFMTTKARSIN